MVQFLDPEIVEMVDKSIIDDLHSSSPNQPNLYFSNFCDFFLIAPLTNGNKQKGEGINIKILESYFISHRRSSIQSRNRFIADFLFNNFTRLYWRTSASFHLNLTTRLLWRISTRCLRNS